MSYLAGAEKYYDLFGAKNDAPFYIDLAHRHGDRALELGVGAARLAIQLARAGVETWGIDNSRHMLRAAEANLLKEPSDVQDLVHINFGDVLDFDLGERFGLIYFPSFSFDHLVAREDQISALKSIHRHMAPDGVYAFYLAHVPKIEPGSGWFAQKRRLDDRRMVDRTGFHRTTPQSRLMSIDLWYELYEDGRMLERYYEGGEVYIHAPEDVRRLLTENGFEIVEMFGGHDRKPFTDASEMMVIVARGARGVGVPS